MRFRKTGRTVLSLALGFVASVALADWNYANDYSTTSNPSGAWTFGSRTSITGTSLTVFPTLSPVTGVTGTLQYWHGTDPFMGTYKCFGPLAFDGGEGTKCPVGEAFLHPQLGVPAVARWTAPTTGSYIITTATSRFGGPPGISQFDLVVNGTSIFSEIVSVFYTFQPTHVETLALSAGDVVDFTVSDALEGINHDSTGLRANIKAAQSVVSTSLLIQLGNNPSGNLASLASDDGDPLVICKGFLPSLTSPFAQLVLQGTATSSVSAITFNIKSKMQQAGVFTQFVDAFNWTSSTYDQTFSNPINTTFALNSYAYSGTISNYLNGLTMQARIRIKQTGFSSVTVPCASIEMANWSVQ